MNRLFRSWTDNTLIPLGLVDYVKNEISTTNAVIHIGCDSAVHGKYIVYVVAVAIRYPTRGAHVIFRKIKLERSQIKSNWERLFKETEFSLDVANYLKEQSVIIKAVELDYNQDDAWFSYKLISACEGWCKSLGYNVLTKPDEMIAVRAADKICNK